MTEVGFEPTPPKGLEPQISHDIKFSLVGLGIGYIGHEIFNYFRQKNTEPVLQQALVKIDSNQLHLKNFAEDFLAKQKI